MTWIFKRAGGSRQRACVPYSKVRAFELRCDKYWGRPAAIIDDIFDPHQNPCALWGHAIHKLRSSAEREKKAISFFTFDHPVKMLNKHREFLLAAVFFMSNKDNERTIGMLEKSWVKWRIVLMRTMMTRAQFSSHGGWQFSSKLFVFFFTSICILVHKSANDFARATCSECKNKVLQIWINTYFSRDQFACQSQNPTDF